MGSAQGEWNRQRWANPVLVAVERGPSAGTRRLVDLQVRAHHTLAVLADPPILTSSCYSAANLPADCINLGQGYMNFAPPSWVREAAEEALKSVPANHYSHPKGRLRLRQAIKNHYEADFGRSLDVDTEILVTSGANEG